MNTKDTIDVIKYHYNIKEGLFKSVVELLLEGEVYRQMIAKMKNEKYDVWVSLPGYFTNLPDFVLDIEREVRGK